VLSARFGSTKEMTYVFHPTYLRFELRKTEGENDIEAHSVIQVVISGSLGLQWLQSLGYLGRVCMNIAQRGVII
jgi:hypothetical protein